jgi:hypothetical protein
MTVYGGIASVEGPMAPIEGALLALWGEVALPATLLSAGPTPNSLKHFP